jgi:hypothetical protein
MVMKRVEKSAVDKVSRPDHGGGPNEETSGQSSKSVSGAERGDAEEHLECPAEVLAVEEPLRN